jgi:two-component system chemotaxis sensor kinase CheA
MDDFQKQVKTAFLEESGQMLLDAEQQFLSLQAMAKAGVACPAELHDELFRLAHNIKGSATIAGFPTLSTFVHGVESLLTTIRNGSMSSDRVALLLEAVDRVRSMVDALKSDFDAHFDNETFLKKIKKACEVSHPDLIVTAAPSIPEFLPAQPGLAKPSETVRISLERLDTLIKRTGELMVLRMALTENSEEEATSLRSQVLLRELDKLSSEVHQSTMNLRMAPVRSVFQNMNRIVREIEKALGKKIKLELQGEETEIDRTVLERITDPLVHLMRNAADHGIESAEKRAAAGKPEVGTIRLSARQNGRGAVIEIQDDGPGLDPDLLIQKAIEKGILNPKVQLTPEAAYQLIFAPGLSTKQNVTEISGRGVGMDVVKSAISKLRGTLQIRTELGKGTCFSIHLPLTLALLDGLVIRSGNDKYVLPCSVVTETLKPSSTGTVQWNGETLPTYRLNDLLGKSGAPATDEPIAIVTHDALHRPISLLVDQVEDQQSVIVQKLESALEELPWVMGGAILGDGQPSLILDLQGVLEVTA